MIITTLTESQARLIKVYGYVSPMQLVILDALLNCIGSTRRYTSLVDDIASASATRACPTTDTIRDAKRRLVKRMREKGWELKIRTYNSVGFRLVGLEKIGIKT